MCNGTEFQALPRPQQKHFLFLLHEQGTGPQALSRLTGVPYSIVQRATSKANEQKYNAPTAMICESPSEDELCSTYCDEDDFQPYPNYQTEWCLVDWLQPTIFDVGHGNCRPVCP